MFGRVNVPEYSSFASVKRACRYQARNVRTGCSNAGKHQPRLVCCQSDTGDMGKPNAEFAFKRPQLIKSLHVHDERFPVDFNMRHGGCVPASKDITSRHPARTLEDVCRPIALRSEFVPLQNRVTPFGDIAALEGRGLVMGNRGILHDDARRIVRPWQVRRWIACRIEFRGRHRSIMSQHSYTELFFLDEATALAAGHRPCAECRYADYQRFRSLWLTRYGEPANADRIDLRLHADRLADGRKRTFRDDLGALPDGTYVDIEGAASLVWRGECLVWSMLGYVKHVTKAPKGTVDVLTPRSIVEVLRDGYDVSVHPSADRKP